jgi:hypothetical protein
MISVDQCSLSSWFRSKTGLSHPRLFFLGACEREIYGIFDDSRGIFGAPSGIYENSRGIFGAELQGGTIKPGITVGLRWPESSHSARGVHDETDRLRRPTIRLRELVPPYAAFHDIRGFFVVACEREIYGIFDDSRGIFGAPDGIYENSRGMFGAELQGGTSKPGITTRLK